MADVLWVPDTSYGTISWDLGDSQVALGLAVFEKGHRACVS